MHMQVQEQEEDSDTDKDKEKEIGRWILERKELIEMMQVEVGCDVEVSLCRSRKSTIDVPLTSSIVMAAGPPN